MRKILLAAVLCAAPVCLLRAQQTDLMMQAWYWDYFTGNNFGNWANILSANAVDFQNAHFKHIWLPPLPRPATFNSYSNGYDPKDLYDFGQYGGDCAWGNRTELDALIANLNSRGMQAVSDVVYNHRDGGRPERNDAVRSFVNSGSGQNPFPSDRCFLVLPLGTANPGQNGAGDYYLKLRSRSFGYQGVQYKIYARTNSTVYNSTVLNEAEPNGGGDCNQAGNTLPLGQDLNGTWGEWGGCHIDEYKITLSPTNYNATDDTLFLYISNFNGNYSDHIVAGLWSSPRAQNIASEIEYWTYTNFNNLPSGQGGMDYNALRPNDGTAYTESLAGDWNWMWFFYDYDQNTPSAQNVLNEWTKWQMVNVGIDGLRMDAIKHFPPAFVGQLLNYLVGQGQYPDMIVGEFFDSNASLLKDWVDDVYASMNASAQNALKVRIFDFALRQALKNACDQFGYDVRNVFQSGLVDGVGGSPFNAVTFINNHDFRSPGELVQNTPMLAYAYILTNNQIGAPCVFYPDFYGIQIPNGPANPAALKDPITQLMDIHEQYIVGSEDAEYLSRFNTPYYQFFQQGLASTSLIYQLKPPPGSQENVIVAINFAGTPLDVYQGVRTDWGVSQGSWFTNLIGNSLGGSQNTQITFNPSHPELRVQIPARSYAVYVQTSAPLPLDLLDFAARPDGDAALLSWRTAREQGFDRFELERAAGTPHDFSTVATVPGRTASADAANDYRHRDDTAPANTTLYYRLKMIDLDGSYTYSPVRSVRIDRARFTARVSPNPGGPESRMVVQSASAQRVQLVITNALGQVVWDEPVTLAEGESLVPLPELDGGVYQIALQGGGGQEVLRFVRQ